MQRAPRRLRCGATAVTPPAPAALGLTLYGPPRLRVGDTVLRLGSRKAVALCVVLLLDGPRSRKQLAALLWPDLEAVAARRNLRRDLFRLRAAGLQLDERDDGAVVLAAPPAVHEAANATPMATPPGKMAPGAAEPAVPGARCASRSPTPARPARSRSGCTGSTPEAALAGPAKSLAPPGRSFASVHRTS